MDDRPDTTPAPAASATGAHAGTGNGSGRSLRRIVIAIAVLLVLLLAWVAAGPWLAIRGIEKAIETRDTAALERHVDFPRLRINLKAQLDVQAGGQLFPGLFACRALEFGVHAGMPPLGDDNGDNGLCA